MTAAHTGSIPTLDDIRDAADRIAPFAHWTPIMTSKTLDAMTGVDLFFKCENFQKAGAFKFRGACNTLMQLTDDEAARGVVTHSSGNHAQALSLAARIRGIPAYIVMPENSAQVKKDAVAGYGAAITYCEPTLSAREKTADGIIRDTGAVLVHPYDDYRIIAGQATAARELLEDVMSLDAIVVPVGGGGLLAGSALVVKGLSPRTQVIGVEPEGADDAKRSLEAGRIIPSENPDTIADGLLTSLGERTFPIIQEHVRGIVTVDDGAIIRAMRFVWERMKLVIEPSAAVPVAAILEGKVNLREKRVGVILSGGNVDLGRVSELFAG